LNVLAEYPIAALNDSAQPDAASAFIEAIISPDGQAVLRAYGFGPAQP
jgi:molybdate transport system substrate-binding protein